MIFLYHVYLKVGMLTITREVTYFITNSISWSTITQQEFFIVLLVK